MTPVAIGDTQGTLQARKTWFAVYQCPETFLRLHNVRFLIPWGIEKCSEFERAKCSDVKPAYLHVHTTKNSLTDNLKCQGISYSVILCSYTVVQEVRNITVICIQGKITLKQLIYVTQPPIHCYIVLPKDLGNVVNLDFELLLFSHFKNAFMFQINTINLEGKKVRARKWLQNSTKII